MMVKIKPKTRNLARKIKLRNKVKGSQSKMKKEEHA